MSLSSDEREEMSAVSRLTNLWPIFSNFFPPCLLWPYFNNVMKEIQSEIEGEDQFWSSNNPPIMCLFQNKVMFLLKIREAANGGSGVCIVILCKNDVLQS